MIIIIISCVRRYIITIKEIVSSRIKIYRLVYIYIYRITTYLVVEKNKQKTINQKKKKKFSTAH